MAIGTYFILCIGGPIYCGEIEEMPTGPCVVCPWHKWCFSLHDGHTIRPEGHSETLAVHPVRLDDHNRVCVGFNSFDPSFFL